MTLTENNRCEVCGNMVLPQDEALGCRYCLLSLGLEETGTGFATPHLRIRSAAMSSPEGMTDRELGLSPMFGGYELLSEIARGGMGVVFRARQISLDRIVAVKLILAGQLATRESLDRFRLEARAAAQLHHPGIVRIFEIGEFETQLFYSMELIDGESLAECINDFRLTLNMPRTTQRAQEKRIAELISRVAYALDFAHQHGVLHRDLKPSNIIVDRAGNPHLTDFGLAKLMGNEAGLSLSNAVMGTPGYVAPEQATGQREVTAVADVYGLGATLYELLTGQPPFLGANAMDTILQAIRSEPVAACKHNPNLHRDLNTIVMRCLNTNPNKRYASARLVAEDLERFLRNEPIVARTTTSGEKIWRWCCRNPSAALMLSSLLLSIVVGMSLVLWQWRRAEQANQQMAANLFLLRWDDVDDMLSKDQVPRALAGVASLLRADPSNKQAAIFGISILENHNFPTPFAPELRSPQRLKLARLSPDGQTIAMVDIDGLVTTWNTDDFTPRCTEVQRDSAIQWLEFSPDSQRLAVCYSDGKLGLWDALSLQSLTSPFVAPEPINRASYSADGGHLLCVSTRFITVLDASNLQPIAGPLEHEGRVVAAKLLDVEGRGRCLFSGQQAGQQSQVCIRSLSSVEPFQRIMLDDLNGADIDADGKKIITIDNTHAAVWDALQGQVLHKMPVAESRMNHVEFTSDGSGLVIRGRNWAQIHHADGQPRTKPMSHFYTLRGSSLSKDSKRLLTWGDDSLAQLWNALTGQREAEPMPHTQRVCFAEMGAIGNQEVIVTTVSHNKLPVVGNQSGSVQIWRMHPKKMPTDLNFGKDPFGYDCHALSPDGQWVFVAKTDGNGWIRHSSTGELVCGPLPLGTGNWGALFTRDQQALITTTSSGKVSRWSMPDGQPLGISANLHTTIQPTELSPDGTQFATGSVDGKCRLWSSLSGQMQFEMDHGSEINSIAFSPDGKWIASAGENHNVCIWNTSTGERSLLLEGHTNEVMRVAYSPNQLWIATVSLDRTARIWDARSGKLLHVLSHNGEVIDVVASPDSRWFATGSRDRTAMIWDAATGKPHARGLFQDQAVRNVVFSPNGQYLLTRDFSGLRLWDASTGAPLTTHLDHPSLMGPGFQCTNGTPQFLPDGRRVFLAVSSHDALLWDFFIPSSKPPAWFADFLEAIAGQRFIQGEEMVEFVPPAKFLAIEKQLRDSSDTDEYTAWAKRWLGD